MLAALLTLLLGIIVTLAIIAACGFFVAQEFAYMSVDRSRLAARAEKGDAQAKRVLAITQRTSFMLSGATPVSRSRSVRPALSSWPRS
jgi:CBS domain containing-hemolysin-like protein